MRYRKLTVFLEIWFKIIYCRHQWGHYLFSTYQKCELYLHFIYLFNIALWKRENVNNAPVYTDHAICAHTYSVTEPQCICDGDHETVEIIAFWGHNILNFMKMHVPNIPDYMMLTVLDLRLEVWPFCRNNCIFNTCWQLLITLPLYTSTKCNKIFVDYWM